jgi:glycosyltransferase involved in cell wall biosynthesis
MKISIITICFNSEKTISDTIKSVLSQTYKNIEYIIVDGESTDNTIHIIQSFGNSISKFVSAKDNGIYDAMNKGIALATGDIIGILNSDDVFFDNGVVENVVKEFDGDKTIDCVYGNILFYDSSLQKVVRAWKNKPYSKYYFEKGEVPPHPALFVKANLYKEVGLYKTNFKISADQEFMLRILKVHQYKSSYINQNLVRMRIGGVSTKGIKSYLISTLEIKKAWNSNGLSYPFWLYFLRPIKKVLQLIEK